MANKIKGKSIKIKVILKKTHDARLMTHGKNGLKAQRPKGVRRQASGRDKLD